MSAFVSPSTLRRSNGSVFDGRTFIHQSRIANRHAVEMVDVGILIAFFDLAQFRGNVLDLTVDFARTKARIDRCDHLADRLPAR